MGAGPGGGGVRVLPGRHRHDHRPVLGQRRLQQQGDASVFVVADRYIDMRDANVITQLREGDQIVDGKIIDKDGKPVQCLDVDGKPTEMRIGLPDEPEH